MIGDRYANSNVMKTAPLAGIQVRSKKFLERCVDSPDKTADVFVSRDHIADEEYNWRAQTEGLGLKRQ